MDSWHSRRIMGLFNYICPQCSKIYKKLVRGLPKDFECSKCKAILVREATGPSVKNIVTVDTGFMSRSLEVLQDGEQIHRERSKIENDPRVNAAKPHLWKDDE